MQMGTNQPKIGGYNYSVVLSAVQAAEGTSRIEIAERTGLTAQTVSVIVRRLMAEGLVREDGTVPSAGGKPRSTLRVNANAGYSVGVHFDPGEVSCVVVDLSGRTIRRSSKRIDTETEPEVLIAETARTAKRLLASARVPAHAVLGVGAACPGPIDQAQGLVISPPRRDRWTEVPIRKLLEEKIGFPVTIDNDATAAAIGERWAGLGRGVSDFAYLYIGTGIGGGVFLANQVYRGASRNAGEFGHIVVERDGLLCYCGNRGCLEAMCRPSAIVEEVIAELRAGRPSRLSQPFAQDPSLVDYRAICKAAAGDDPLARSVIDRAAGYLAMCAVTIANVLDLQLLILGGHAMAYVGEIYCQRIARALRELPVARKVHRMQVATSSLTEDAIAVGAATLVFHKAFAPSVADLTSDWSATSASIR
jgi:predicted NBD/HSP70 family sugar kinase